MGVVTSAKMTFDSVVPYGQVDDARQQRVPAHVLGADPADPWWDRAASADAVLRGPTACVSGLTFDALSQVRRSFAMFQAANERHRLRAAIHIASDDY